MARILFVGDGWLGSNARSLAEGFATTGHDVVLVDTTRVSRPARLRAAWVYSKVTGRRYPGDVQRIHAEIDVICREWHPAIVFCFKTTHLLQERLLESGGPALKVHYSADDVSNPAHLTADYLSHETSWDLIVTTKRYNVPELEQRAVRNSLFVFSAYDPAWHHRTARRGLPIHEVGFIGNMRPDRKQLVVNLAREHRSRMAVRGPGWNRVDDLTGTGALVGPAVYGEDFSIAVAGIQANLILLNSDNRDTHTCRTFEVPAAGGLFVGARTADHAELIGDGVEGFLYDSPQELGEILGRLARDPVAARKVANRGHRAITAGNNTYADRARQITDHLALTGHRAESMWAR